MLILKQERIQSRGRSKKWASLGANIQTEARGGGGGGGSECLCVSGDREGEGGNVLVSVV